MAMVAIQAIIRHDSGNKQRQHTADKKRHFYCTILGDGNPHRGLITHVLFSTASSSSRSTYSHRRHTNPDPPTQPLTHPHVQSADGDGSAPSYTQPQQQRRPSRLLFRALPEAATVVVVAGHEEQRYEGAHGVCARKAVSVPRTPGWMVITRRGRRGGRGGRQR